jgi:uncharacterized membrane protein YfcA
MEIAGYLASVFIGITLGLIGGGGSILAVPILVYLFRVHPVTATTYSLFIVGITSATGSYAYIKKGLVNLRTAFVFGLPALAAVFITRLFILPAIPDEITTIGNATLTKGMLLLLLFAVLMIAASVSMIRKNSRLRPHTGEPRTSLLLLQGAATGVITGLVGAGGGFMIIPALVLFAGISMTEAVGTSLLIITVNSLAGFFTKIPGDISWPLLTGICLFALAGLGIGIVLAGKINGKRLKPAFGWFVLASGTYILLKETIFK